MLILASELPSKGVCLVRAASPRAVAGIHSGDGPSVNVKEWPCEDSVALHAKPDGSLIAAVADAHFGGAAGEAVASGLGQAWAPGEASPCEGLERTLRALETAWHAARPPGDRSATTALLVHVAERRVSWVHAGDSHLLTVSEEGCRARAAHARGFLGDSPRCELERGSFELAAHETLLLATDGLDEDMSGLALADVSRILRTAGPLDGRVRALLEAAGSARRGGGRDNLALVAIEPA